MVRDDIGQGVDGWMDGWMGGWVDGWMDWWLCLQVSEVRDMASESPSGSAF